MLVASFRQHSIIERSVLHPPKSTLPPGDTDVARMRRKTASIPTWPWHPNQPVFRFILAEPLSGEPLLMQSGSVTVIHDFLQTNFRSRMEAKTMAGGVRFWPLNYDHLLILVPSSLHLSEASTQTLWLLSMVRRRQNP